MTEKEANAILIKKFTTEINTYLNSFKNKTNKK